MFNSLVKEIKERVLMEQPKTGCIEIKMIFHANRLNKYNFSKIESSVSINEFNGGNECLKKVKKAKI